jgi:hypothetical protein
MGETVVSSGRRPREILLVGSVPLRPVSKVFETVARHLGELAPRIPDGEMMGWLRSIWRSHAENPGLQQVGIAKLNGRATVGAPIYRPKPGVKPEELKLGPYGYVANAVASYAEFRKLRDAGKIPPRTRMQITMPGPGTTSFIVQMDAATLLPIARAALWAEIEGILNAIPAADLTIHLDVAMEAEKEEYVRRPNAFDTPIQTAFYWTQDQMAESVAWLAERIPVEAELGFHICSIWHHWPDSGQDNAVLVDTANALARRIKRPIAYVHIPVIPEHDKAEDYAAFKQLNLHPETSLILGLVNLQDGLEGARRRVALAEQVLPNFGIAMFCGLGMPPADGGYEAQRRALGLQAIKSAFPPEAPQHPGLRRATPEDIGEVLDLHRQVAEL